MNYLMGIDLGSTSLKAVIYDINGNAVASGTSPTEKFNPNANYPEWTVWQPEQIWGGTAAAIKEAISQMDDPSSIKAVSVTGMGMDALPVDEDGNWLYPFISWHDPRTEPQQQWWLENIGADKTFSITGWAVWGFNTALRILWMAEHEPQIHARTDKWLLIEDFLNYMLCGRQATDYTMASCTLLFDQRTLDWSDEILALANIERRLMCDPHPAGTVLGEVSPAASAVTGLQVGTPVVLGGHDFLCGALPVGAFKPGVVLDVTGTWEIILTAIPELVLTAEARHMGMTLESHVARDMYVGWGGAVAADMLEWYRKEFGSAAMQIDDSEGSVDWDALMTMAAASPAGCKGLMFLPHMSGVSFPIVDPRSMGSYVGLNQSATRGDMLRAIIEGLDYQFLHIVNSMESGLGLKRDKIVAVGGAVRNRFWMQNKADVVGRPIEVPEVEEATALGAAILAGIGIGLYKNEQDAFDHVNKQGEIFQPNPKLASLYEGGYRIYEQLYPALKPISHQLYDQFRK